eukprot:Amastigsp_a175620_30.p2 type:complete len:213 gc:universal Amastigsp_a175620_30:763-125(-)
MAAFVENHFVDGATVVVGELGVLYGGRGVMSRGVLSRCAVGKRDAGCAPAKHADGVSIASVSSCAAVPKASWRADVALSFEQGSTLFPAESDVRPATDAAAALLALAMQPQCPQNAGGSGRSSDAADELSSKRTKFDCNGCAAAMAAVPVDQSSGHQKTKRSYDEAALYSPMKAPEVAVDLSRLTKRMKVSVREPGDVTRIDAFRRALTYSF